MGSPNLVSEAWRLLWQRRYLPVLGAAIAAAGGGVDAGLGRLILALIGLNPLLPPALREPALPETFSGLPLPDAPAVGEMELLTLLAVGGGALTALLCGALVALIAAAVIARTAAGALIAGAGGFGDFRAALHTGWQRVWRLIIIISIPPIPITVGAILTVAGLGAYLLAAGMAGDVSGGLALLRESRGLLAAFALLNALLLMVSLLLAVVQILADRACVINDARPVEAFRRGWRVLRHQPVPVIGLLALQLGAGAAAAILLHLPRLLGSSWLLSLCLLQPVGWLLTGLLIAFFSTLWTLAWLRWSDHPAGELLPEA